MKLVKVLAVLALATAGCILFFSGCSDDPVAPVLPEPCNLILNCTPIAGSGGTFYFCSTNSEEDWTFVRNGADQSVEFGGVVFAVPGDIVSACTKECGCTHAQVLR